MKPTPAQLLRARADVREEQAAAERVRGRDHMEAFYTTIAICLTEVANCLHNGRQPGEDNPRDPR